jgi:hypothetical protein
MEDERYEDGKGTLKQNQKSQQTQIHAQTNRRLSVLQEHDVLMKMDERTVG